MAAATSAKKPPSSGSHPLQFLHAARRGYFRGHRRVGKAGLPVGDADLADIDVALRIQRDAVRGEEFAALEARTVLAAEPRDARAFRIHDREARTEIRHLAVDRHAGTEFADDEVGLLAAAAATQRAGPVQIIPLRLVFAVAVEHLDTMVLAVGDVNPAIRIGDNIVHDVELAGIGAGLAPR